MFIDNNCLYLDEQDYINIEKEKNNNSFLNILINIIESNNINIKDIMAVSLSIEYFQYIELFSKITTTIMQYNTL